MQYFVIIMFSKNEIPDSKAIYLEGTIFLAFLEMKDGSQD